MECVALVTVSIVWLVQPLILQRTIGELIADGHHVVPAACKGTHQAKRLKELPIITDCMSAGGCPDGDYMLGELPVIVKNGTARLKKVVTLAGSILQL